MTLAPVPFGDDGIPPTDASEFSELDEQSREDQREDDEC